MDAKDFILADFEQQYEEYRQAELSRTRYVEYYGTLLAAILAFYGMILQLGKFPIEDSRIAILFMVLFLVVGEIGRRLVGILVSTRIAQLLTAEYINKIREYFSKYKGGEILDFAKIAISEKWFDEKSHAIRLISLVLLISGFAFSLATYQLIQLISPISPDVFDSSLIKFDSTSIKNREIIGGVLAVVILTLYYFCYRKHVKSELEKKRK